MASLVAKMVAKKVFQENSANKQGQEDPYFETVPATRLGFKTTKKRKRALPPGLTEQEERVLTKVKRRAYRLDLSLFSLCGLRFGWSSVIGLIPFVGDFGDMLLALMVYRTCCTIEPEIPASLKAKMQMNIVIDFVIGLVPFIGDIADAAYKCNTKNAVLLEDELRKRGQKRLASQGQHAVPDPSLEDEFDYEEEDRLRQEHGPPPGYTSRTQSRRDGRHSRREYDVEAAGHAQPPRPARTR
eukprot:c44602_g1_i1 orf=70-795(+)